MEQIDIGWLLGRPIAHRGLYDNTSEIPENSLLSFERAIEKGFPIELDVQVTADQEVIVFHDSTLERLCKRKKRVSTLTRKDLSLYKLLNTDHLIPLLKEVLKLVDGKVPLLIEIKRQPEIKKANQIILNTLLGYDGKFAIQSFDPFVLKWFVDNAPLIPRGQLSSDFKDVSLPGFQKWLLKNMLLNSFSKPHFIAYDIEVLPNHLVERKRSKGCSVLGWTVKSARECERVISYCDNIIFENFLPSEQTELDPRTI